MYKIYNFQDLLHYGLKCCNGGRWKQSVQSFEINILQRTAQNYKAIKLGKYKPKKTNDFLLNERGKMREIKAHNIMDRQVYKTFCNIDMIPKCQKFIVENNSASQTGKGIEHNIKAFKQALAHAYKVCKGNDFYVVTYDFHDYFASIPHDLSLERMNEILGDDSLLQYMKDYSQLFPSGYGIGGEPSQVMAIVYPSKLDRMLLCDPLVLDSCRYMDDGVVIVRTLKDARIIENKIRERVAIDGLIMNEKHTNIVCMKKASVSYLKKRFSMLDSGKIIVKLTRKNINARIRCIKKQKQELDSGKRTFESVLQSFQSWASYATSYNAHKDVMKVANVFSEIFNIPFRDVMKIVNGHGINHLLSQKESVKNSRIKGGIQMGFKVGATMTVWDRYDKETQNFTKWQASISKKNQTTGDWESVFRDFVIFIGDAKDRAATLKKGDRIKLKEIDVTNKSKDSKTYYDFVVYDYDLVFSDNKIKEEKEINDFQSIIRTDNLNNLDLTSFANILNQMQNVLTTLQQNNSESKTIQSEIVEEGFMDIDTSENP